MKENKYDEPAFFNKYSSMSRSVEGLSGAGEWHVLEKMLPDFTGKRVLDIGCGYGWHCLYAARHGAGSVTGIDISRRMIGKAIEINSDPVIWYRVSALEELEAESCSFDIVISSLVFHYAPAFEEIAIKVYRMLDKAGSFIFSVEHPVFTAQGPQEWIYDTTGRKLHWPVDNYFVEGERESVFLGEKVVKYHRTASTYHNDLLKAGFTIDGFAEPQPPELMIRQSEDMKDETRRPMMLIISAKKL